MSELPVEIELYGARTGNCLRAAVALEEAGLAYRPVRVDLRSGEHQGPAYLARNPAGKVPIISVDAGFGEPLIITQSNAIILYAAERSEGRLLPDAPASRARTLERFFFFVTDVVAPGMASFQLRRGGMAEAALLLEGRAQAMFESSEHFLDGGPYLAGSDFSIVDIVAVTIASAYEKTIPWTALPRFKAWYDRVLDRPAVHRGLHVFDPPPRA